MNRGGKAALLISCMTICGCTAASPGVEVRAIANPSAEIARSGDAVAVARGHLVLGNVGLALEAFRKAQRDNPADPAVLAGIGDCYSAMSRFDLAQTNYEAALALAPHDRKLLLGLAAIYDREGMTARAMIARAEAAAGLPRPTASTAAVVPQGEPRVPARVETAIAMPVQSAQAPVAIPKPAIGSITVELPKARPVGQLASQGVAPAVDDLDLAQDQLAQSIAEGPAVLAQPRVTTATLRDISIELAAAAPANRLQTRETPPTSELLFAEAEPASVPSAPLIESRDRTISKPALRSVTVALPPALPAQRLDQREIAATMPQVEEYAAAAPSSITVPLPPARPAPTPLPARDDRSDPAVALAPAPRLERLSRGEVALVSTGKPIWKSPGNVQVASTGGIRWLALDSSRDRPNVRVLNAARSQGLAASARTVLFDRGWRKIAVGDAPEVLRKSVVLYPKGREALGRRLARQFGVSAQIAERDDVVLILGRDSIRRIGG
jgi:hypothetical protein